MGLFDKLLSVIDMAKSKLQQGTQQNDDTNYFLSDDTERKYYEITYGLLESVGNANASFEEIKKYIEHFNEGVCDIETLKKVCSFFMEVNSLKGCTMYTLYREDAALYFLQDRSDIGKVKARQIVELNMQLSRIGGYKYTKEDALNICYNYNDSLEKIEASVKSQYENVLNVVEDKGVKFFREGVERIVEQINKKYGRVFTQDKTKTMIHSITKDKFMKDHRVVKEILFAYIDFNLSSAQKLEAAANVALRAAHFENYGKSKKGYTGIDYEECRNFILSEAYFKSQIDEHPFDEEKVIKETIGRIMQADVFSAQKYYWMPNKTEFYYADMLCNQYWNRLAELNHLKETPDVCYIYKIISAAMR